MTEEAIAGCSTNKNFLELQKTAGENNYAVLLHGKIFSTFCGTAIDQRNAEKIVEIMNDAFRTGFAQCGSELMPKIMKLEDELRKFKNEKRCETCNHNLSMGICDADGGVEICGEDFSNWEPKK